LIATQTISYWNINVQVFIGDSSNGDGDEIVEVLVIFVNEVAVGFGSND